MARDDNTLAASTAPEQRTVIGRPFVPGMSGNPRGRPKGSRNKFTEDFMRELSDAFATKGRAAIDTVMDTEPAKFLQVCASLMPKDVQLSAKPLAELSDDELAHAIHILERLDAAGISALRIGTTIEGTATVDVQAVPEAEGVPRGGQEPPAAAADGGESGGEDPFGWGRSGDAPDGEIPG